MNFKINNRDWKIIELSQEEMRNVIKNYKYMKGDDLYETIY